MTFHCRFPPKMTFTICYFQVWCCLPCQHTLWCFCLLLFYVFILWSFWCSGGMEQWAATICWCCACTARNKTRTRSEAGPATMLLCFHQLLLHHLSFSTPTFSPQFKMCKIDGHIYIRTCALYRLLFVHPSNFLLLLQVMMAASPSLCLSCLTFTFESQS